MLDQMLMEIDQDLEEFRRRLRVRVRRGLREAFGEAVGGAAFRVVRELELKGPLSPAELAAGLEVRSSTMTAHLDRLEQLGWVRREAALSRGRVQVIVTASGREAQERYAALRRRVLGEALRPLSAAELKGLAIALRAALDSSDTRAERGDI